MMAVRLGWGRAGLEKYLGWDEHFRIQLFPEAKDPGDETVSLPSFPENEFLFRNLFWWLTLERTPAHRMRHNTTEPIQEQGGIWWLSYQGTWKPWWKMTPVPLLHNEEH